MAGSGHLEGRWLTRDDLAEYYTAIERFDRGVGLVLNALKDAGQIDNTVVVVISDNGAPMPNAKKTLYDTGVRMPMIVRAPGVKAGLVPKAMVSWVDLVPAFFDWAQLGSDSRRTCNVPLRNSMTSRLIPMK